MSLVSALASSPSRADSSAIELFVGQAGTNTVVERDDVTARAMPALDTDLSRDVFCVLGMPIDSVDMSGTIRRFEAAAAGGTSFLVSTANLNFLVNSRRDPEFRESLLQSDLCVADGMPLIWIAALLGLPIKQRIAGCDILDALKRRPGSARQLTAFMFGGPDGVAAAATAALNAENCALASVGSMSPGFGSVEDLSSQEIIHAINESHAHFLVVALGAPKGQAWLMRNHDKLRIPIRVHLGAAINVQAGSIKRAPRAVRALGLEWLWRIKEEPQLWKRYWHDGKVLLHMLVTRILPLAIESRLARARCRNAGLHIATSRDQDAVTFRLSGAASEANVDKAIECFRHELVGTPSVVTVNLADTTFIDARFLGLLFMLRKQLKGQCTQLIVTGLRPAVERLFRLHEAGFLLTDRRSA